MSEADALPSPLGKVPAGRMRWGIQLLFPLYEGPRETRRALTPK